MLSSVSQVLMMKEQKKSKIDTKDGETDRLSHLPDHILVHIIEFMIIEHSVRTSVLSKRWKDLWKSLSNLNLIHLYAGKSLIFNNFVSQILSGRDDSIALHSLKYLHVDIVDAPETTLLEAVKYAASHNVQHLTVIAGIWKSAEDLSFPASIFCCHSLTFLELNFWHPLPRNDLGKKMFPKSLYLPALKTLHLIHLTFTTNDNGYAEPFSTCNMLKTLVIDGCYLQDDAQALCIFNSNVSSLIASGSSLIEKARNHQYVFYTPKLVSLTIAGRPNFLAPCARSLPSLREVKIDYFYFYKPYEDFVLQSCLCLLANVNIITLGFNTLQEILRVLNNNGTQHPCFLRLKSLKVELYSNLTISNERVRGMITDLLQNSPQAGVDIIRNTNRTL